MEKTTIIKKLFNKKNQDYTYTILFFFIFSFFIFYVIRPNLRSVFEINSKIDQLKEVNLLYKDQIDKIIDIQSTLEVIRDDLYLLPQAVAEKPEVNKVLSDINVSTEGSSIRSERLSIADINLKDKGTTGKIKSFIVEMEVKGSFEDIKDYVKNIFNQRRLKMLKLLSVERDKKESTQSSSLKIRLEVEGYYL